MAQSLTQTSSLAAVKWQSVIRIPQGQSHLVLLDHLHICLLQWNLSCHLNQFQDLPSTEAPVLEDTQQAAKWLLDQDPSKCTSNFSYHLFTDACPMGLGAYMEEICSKASGSH